MKKNWLITIALMLALVVVCAACGDSGSGDEAEEEDLPMVTAPPALEGDDDIIGAEENSRPDPSDKGAYEAWLASLSKEQRYVEENLVGAGVDELIDYLGEPNSIAWAPSCIMADAEDGTYSYDGFYVSTTRFPNGTEYVMGTLKKK